MKMRIDRAVTLRRSAAFMAAAPFALGLAWLAGEIFFPEGATAKALNLSVRSHFVLALWASSPIYGWLGLRAVGLGGSIRSLWLGTLVALCLLAPMAVLSAWFIAPSPLGVGLGDFAAFVGWLDRYPTLGPVNRDVWLGLLCVLGASSIPALFAIFILDRTAARAAVKPAFLAIAVAFQGIAYVPVFLNLDVGLLTYAASWLAGTPTTLLTTDHVPSLATRLSEAAAGGAGALVRLTATAALLLLAARKSSVPDRDETTDSGAAARTA